jgi:hypothetical protein
MRVEDPAEPRVRSAEAMPLTGHDTKRRPRKLMRHPWRVVALLVLVALLAGLGGGGLYANSIRREATGLEATLISDLERGQAELEAGKTSLKQANTAHDEKLIAQAKAHFSAAQVHFKSASQTADKSKLLHQLEGLPYIGPEVKTRHTSVDSVADMGIQLSLAGGHLADLEGQLIKPAGSGQEGSSLLAVVGQVQSQIGSVTAELKSALAAANRVDLTILPASQQASFQHARGSITQALAGIIQFQSLVPVMTEVLGGNGARTYLIEQVNPAELRPGGGFIGTYSVLRADHGALSLIASGNAADLIQPRVSVGQAGYVAPPLPFEQFIPGTGWSFIDSNFFVDFPSNATAGESFAGPHLHVHIDATIAIDYYTVAGMLSVTGPIAVPGYNVTLSAANFVSTAVQYDIESLSNPAAAAIHKAILSAVAGPLLQRIVTLQPSQWPALIGALNTLAASRDLQVYFNNGDVEKTMSQYGWSGVLNTTRTADYMMEIEANLGGTKANYFITRHYTVELTRIGPVIHHKVSVDITDNMPYSYVPHEYYHAYIQMLMSGKADSTSTNLSIPHREMQAPPMTKLLDGWINLHGYGHDHVVTFDWNTPWQPSGRGVEQIYWQKQPGTQADKVDVIWHDGNGHTYKVSGDLAQDRVITLAPNGVSLLQGQVGTAQLPSLSLG